MTYPHLALSAGAHDRLGVLRRDESWLDQRWAAATSRVLVVSGTRVRPVEGGLPWLPTSEAPDGVRVLLGERDGTTYWAVIVGPEAAASRRGSGTRCAACCPRWPATASVDAPLVFHALGLAEWHWVTRHCPRCGGGLGRPPRGTSWPAPPAGAPSSRAPTPR